MWNSFFNTAFCRFLNAPMFYFHDGKGSKWTRLEFLLLAFSMIVIWTIFIMLMNVVFGSLNPR